MKPDLSMPITQAEFGHMVGISPASVSEWMKIAALGPGVSAHTMLLAYCARIREFAAGRGSDGELDLVQERAALARAQRESQELKNAIQRKEFAPIGLLSEVLAGASSSLAAKLDAIPGMLKKTAPELGDDSLQNIAAEIARARNEWVADTLRLEVKTDLSALAVDDDDDQPEDDDGRP